MKATICQMCGDKGFSVALVHCDKCQRYAVHRYCLAVLPATFDENVTWFCADCEPKVAKPCTIGDLAPKKSHFENLRAVQATQAVVRSKKKNRRNTRTRKDKKKKMDVPKSVADAQICESNQDITESVADAPICESIPTCQLLEVDCSDNHGKYHKLGEEKSDVQEDGDNSGEEAESFKFEASQSATEEPSNILHQNISVHAQPIVDPIWWGSFSFLNENLGPINGLVAHLSSFACSKVAREAKLFPALLGLELLPRSHVWPKGFEKSRPTGDNIGLYFFPDSERDEKVFDTLVNDMIDRDFAMRAVVENADLLIFTSTVLPLQYWRFKLKFYLWGVFRAKQALRSSNDQGGREEEDLKKTPACDTRSPISTWSNGISTLLIERLHRSHAGVNSIS